MVKQDAFVDLCNISIYRCHSRVDTIKGRRYLLLEKTARWKNDNKQGIQSLPIKTKKQREV